MSILRQYDNQISPYAYEAHYKTGNKKYVH